MRVFVKLQIRVALILAEKTTRPNVPTNKVFQIVLVMKDMNQTTSESVSDMSTHAAMMAFAVQTRGEKSVGETVVGAGPCSRIAGQAKFAGLTRRVQVAQLATWNA